MKKHTYYTAVGHFQRRTNSQGRSCPTIIINERENYLDMQEMALWTALNWRLLEFPQVMAEYDKLDRDCILPACRTPEDCLGRLTTRGLVCLRERQYRIRGPLRSNGWAVCGPSV